MKCDICGGEKPVNPHYAAGETWYVCTDPDCKAILEALSDDD